ncbi:restriction endonuclease [Spirulina subsalsa FACHB-351]|uniref:Restriction endonuclease n=1 Tax=Spirulina subsalsa FACHB-351 TaxID=234711 RepID=A0ABT3L1K4_9CYAN|nr:restriction endonuclease [Spirulina subsalsa]MCW6035388.1 restriction endonuclease [Spirulina subsalsa FACHB-351]
MNSSTLPKAISLGFCTFDLDVEALLAGELIALPAKKFLRSGQCFALIPVFSGDLIERNYYHPNSPSFSPLSHPQNGTDSIQIKGWVECRDCEIVEPSDLDTLAQATIWTPQGLREHLQDRPYLFLAYFRVYELPKVLEIPTLGDLRETVGDFVRLEDAIAISPNHPILTEEVFQQRCQQLQQRQPAPLPEIVPSAPPEPPEPPSPPPADQNTPTPPPTPVILEERDWKERIAETGNSSQGHEFEKLVRQSLLFLGFRNTNPTPKANLDPNSTGGAGGADFYADYPYSIVGECKATKSEKVRNKVTSQLIHLGVTQLTQQEFDQSLKLICAAGKLTPDAEQAAKEHKMNVIRPETLENLVKLKAEYPGSIDLWKFKKWLEKQPFGEASDEKIQGYIREVSISLEIRFHLVQLIQEINEPAGLEYIRGKYDSSSPPQPLSEEQLRDILIELTSPLTGYLGWEKTADGGRRFYRLRSFDQV